LRGQSWRDAFCASIAPRRKDAGAIVKGPPYLTKPSQGAPAELQPPFSGLRARGREGTYVGEWACRSQLLTQSRATPPRSEPAEGSLVRVLVSLRWERLSGRLGVRALVFVAAQTPLFDLEFEDNLAPVVRGGRERRQLPQDSSGRARPTRVSRQERPAFTVARRGPSRLDFLGFPLRSRRAGEEHGRLVSLLDGPRGPARRRWWQRRFSRSRQAMVGQLAGFSSRVSSIGGSPRN